MQLLAVAGLVFLLDRITKAAVIRALPEGASRPLIPGVLHLTHVQNPGAAFSLLPDRGGFLLAVSCAAVVGILIAARHVREPWARAALGLLLGGAAGNLLDRLRTGTVTDFIDLRIWPVFNVADMAVVAGSGLLALYLLREDPPAAPPGEG